MDKIKRMNWVSSFSAVAQLQLAAPSRYDLEVLNEERFRELDQIVKEGSAHKSPIVINLLEDQEDSFTVRVITNRRDMEVRYIYG